MRTEGFGETRDGKKGHRRMLAGSSLPRRGRVATPAQAGGAGCGKLSSFMERTPPGRALRARPPSSLRGEGLALHLAVPALVPVGALLIDRIPIDHDQLLRALADRRHA